MYGVADINGAVSFIWVHRNKNNTGEKEKNNNRKTSTAQKDTTERMDAVNTGTLTVHIEKCS